jgi:hypothetical protein
LRFFEVNFDGSRLAIPEWMTRRDLCARLRGGVDPVVDWDALRQVRVLLDAKDL